MIARVLGRFRRQSSFEAAILGYHRVADLERDHYSLCVSRTRFEEQLDVLRREACVLSLNDIVTRLVEGKAVPRRSVVMTFDDGYSDNLHDAIPRLRAFQMPATFYVFTAWIGTNREAWWDDLERLILSETRLPHRLAIPNVAGELETADRRVLFDRVYTLLITASRDQKNRILSHLHEITETSWEAREMHRGMTREELCDLATSSGACVGFHTVSHPWLPSLAPADQRRELMESRAWLEELLHRPVNHLSYPHGGFSTETLEAAGQDCARSAVTVDAGVVNQSSDPLRLPRFMVQNWTGSEFSRRLNAWFDQHRS